MMFENRSISKGNSGIKRHCKLPSLGELVEKVRPRGFCF